MEARQSHFGGEQLQPAFQEPALQEERNRIATELHDGISQNLALLTLKMEIISRLADTDPPRMKAELTKVMVILESTVQELRRLIDSLRPSDPAHFERVPAETAPAGLQPGQGDERRDSGKTGPIV
jgi:signal transduction histidine kinase